MSEFIVIGQRAEDGIAIDFSKPAVGELVRCKDCKYYHKDAMMPVHPVLGGGTVIENHCDMSCVKLKDEDYCSYGERKEPENE